MNIYSDGNISLTWEEQVSKVRFYDLVLDLGSKPDFIGVTDIIKWTDSVCEIRGLNGSIDRRHLRLLAEVLLEKKFKFVFVSRADDKRMGILAQKIDGGEFSGMYKIDLERAFRILSRGIK